MKSVSSSEFVSFVVWGIISLQPPCCDFSCGLFTHTLLHNIIIHCEIIEHMNIYSLFEEAPEIKHEKFLIVQKVLDVLLYCRKYCKVMS